MKTNACWRKFSQIPTILCTFFRAQSKHVPLSSSSFSVIAFSQVCLLDALLFLSLRHFALWTGSLLLDCCIARTIADASCRCVVTFLWAAVCKKSEQPDVWSYCSSLTSTQCCAESVKCSNVFRNGTVRHSQSRGFEGRSTEKATGQCHFCGAAHTFQSHLEALGPRHGLPRSALLQAAALLPRHCGVPSFHVCAVEVALAVWSILCSVAGGVGLAVGSML